MESGRERCGVSCHARFRIPGGGSLRRATCHKPFFKVVASLPRAKCHTPYATFTLYPSAFVLLLWPAILPSNNRMTPDEIRERFTAITVWKRGSERALQKPLLALYAIGRVLRGEPRMAAYGEIDRDLGKLLIELGPRRQLVHPEYSPRFLSSALILECLAPLRVQSVTF
jgi:hypothetical protein